MKSSLADAYGRTQCASTATPAQKKYENEGGYSRAHAVRPYGYARAKNMRMKADAYGRDKSGRAEYVIRKYKRASVRWFLSRGIT